MASQVSIPHRYGKNFKDDMEVALTQEVSIPHRYGKNKRTDAGTSMREMFPFLIGTVRTHHC